MFLLVVVHFDLSLTQMYVGVQDATANDIPSEPFDVKGFPTIYFRSVSGNVVAYEGDRTKEDFISFIEKNKPTTSHGEETNTSTKTEEPKKTDASAAKDEL